MIQRPLAETTTSAARFQTAEEFAHERLRSLILSGELPGGSRLNQDELAEKLQISRMPIRQAIRRLESEGLVVNRPNRGAVVTQLGPAAILELFEMRSVLEGLAVRLAVPNLTPAQLEEAEERADHLAEAQSDVGVWLQRHDEFHDFLCAFADRPRLTASIRQLRQSVIPYLRVYLSNYERAEISGFEHHALLRELAGRDPEVSDRAMRQHVMSAGTGVVEFVRGEAPGKDSQRRQQKRNGE